MAEADPPPGSPASRLRRAVASTIHKLDFGAGRLARKRRVLVELRTPVYHAVLGPIVDALRRDPTIELLATSERPEGIRSMIGDIPLVERGSAEWKRFALYVNADPWAAVRLRRCEHRINFFHGVAGKYDLDAPHSLPLGFDRYDRVAFINRDRMQRYLAAELVTPEQAILVGYPKLDRLARGEVDGQAVRERLQLDASRPTILYAPTYSPASSLHLAGERIATGLADAGFNVIVKLHDRSLDADPRYNAGIDWRARFHALARPGRLAYVEQADASELMAAADGMVTDHSSVGFEYLVLDRPLVVFDAPDLPAAARINPEKVALLRSAAAVVASAGELANVVRQELAAPERLSGARRRVAEDMFHRPGTATARALNAIHALIGRGPSAEPALAAAVGPIEGGRP